MLAAYLTERRSRTAVASVALCYAPEQSLDSISPCCSASHAAPCAQHRRLGDMVD
ncbi:MAG: hypothetical protein NVSMB65_20990 [Chloroflexota bacterium]